jgi:hypothetical protein
MKYSFVLEIEEVRGFCLLHKLDDKIVIKEFLRFYQCLYITL